MHKTEYRKTTRARPPGVKSDPRGGKSKFLEKRWSPTAQNGYHQQHKTVITNSTKRLSPTAQNGYHQQHKNTMSTYRTPVVTKSRRLVSLWDTSKKVIEKNEGWGHIWPRVAVWGLIRQQEEEEEERAGERKQKLFCLIPEQWYHNEET